MQTSDITDNKPKGVKSLKDVVKRVLFEDGETTMHKYALYKGFGVDFLRDYYIDGGKDVKSVVLDVDSVKRVQLPDDYIHYTKIGVRVGSNVRVFLSDDTLSTIWNQDDCENDTANPETPDWDRLKGHDYSYTGSWYFSNVINGWGEHVGTRYGFGNERISDAFSFYKDHIILNGGTSADQIILEYISSDMVYGEDTCVPITAEEACKTYIRWKVVDVDRKTALNLKETYRQRFSNEWRKAIARKQKITTEDIMNVVRSHFMMAPKT
jgi:hypothetical protein